MSHPIIGITCGSKIIATEEAGWFVLPVPYVQMISAAGGAPLVIPSISDQQLHTVFDLLEGLLFSGGGDIHPKFYKAPIEADLREVDEARDQTLLQRVVATGKPFLAICRGTQLLNMALGGNLYQNLTSQFPNALPHDTRPLTMDQTCHRVILSLGSQLPQWIGALEIDTNSFHHQAIKQLSPGLRVCGRSSDDVIEAVELLGHPFGLGVQWHPEPLPARAETEIIFSAFVRAAAG